MKKNLNIIIIITLNIEIWIIDDDISNRRLENFIGLKYDVNNIGILLKLFMDLKLTMSTVINNKNIINKLNKIAPILPNFHSIKYKKMDTNDSKKKVLINKKTKYIQIGIEYNSWYKFEKSGSIIIKLPIIKIITAEVKFVNTTFTILITLFFIYAPKLSLLIIILGLLVIS